MDVTDENLQALAGRLVETLSPVPAVQKEATKFLMLLEGNQNYGILLLHLLDKNEVDPHIRQSAAVTFKNFINRNWKVTEDTPDKIHQQDRELIKQQIVGYMLKSPEQIQKQLSVAISIIGREDFPGKWPNLITEMVSKFETGDFHVINGILRTAHSLFKRYRHEFKSQALWEEIKFVLENFSKPFTELFIHFIPKSGKVGLFPRFKIFVFEIVHVLGISGDLDPLLTRPIAFLALSFLTHMIMNCPTPPDMVTRLLNTRSAYKYIHILLGLLSTFVDGSQTSMNLAQTHAKDPNALKVIFSSIVLICKIFYSLNFQDIPEHFEDNMGTWMTHFLTLLSADNKLLQTEDEEEAGLLEQVKSQICDNVALYAQKYDEEFSPQLPNFVTAIWNLLVTTGQQVKYDLLVSNAIQFLASVAERPSYKSLFEDPNTLASICEKVIVPNMQFRTADEELFEDDPEEYIRRDIEGSDVDTRRRSACDLVQALCKSFEGPVIQNFSQYVQGLLGEYASNPPANWKSKDVAIYLVTSLAAKAQTQKRGITQTSNLVNITDFFQSHILPDLQQADVTTSLILKADAIKYLMIFRSQMPKEALLGSIPHLIRLLKCPNRVVHTYAAHTLERIFMVRNPEGGPLISNKEIQPHAQELIRNLVEAMNHPGSTENEYIMKALMRSMSTLQEQVIAFMPQLMKFLTEQMAQASKNPSKPHFNHYLFESLCIAIKTTCKHSPEAVVQFEGALFQPFTEILQQDVQEFIPYVFQILSLLVDHCQGEMIPETYIALFPHLLAPALWERPGNITPLVRLIQAYIGKGSKQIGADSLNGLLGVFQKLIASKTNDHEGFYLLNTIIEHMARDVVNQYTKPIFVLLFQRLSSSKTTKYIKSLLVFFSLFASLYGGNHLIEIVDSIQPKMFGMVIERLYLQDLQKVSGHLEKKICAVGVTNILTESPVMLQTYESFWPQLLQALISQFELPEDESVPDDEHFIEIEDTPGYQTAYSQLAFAGKKERDPFAQTVPNAKVHLAKQLQKLSAQHPGKITQFISSGIQPEAHNFLQQYLNAAGVTLG